jgi:hypothetical protein
MKLTGALLLGAAALAALAAGAPVEADRRPAAASAAPLEADRPAAASAAPAQAATPAPAPGAAPFGVGEKATYRVSYNVVGRVGSGTMNIGAIDTIRGRPAYHIVYTLQGRFLFARVDNRFESWLDVAGTYTHRFEQWTHEVNFRRRRTREFFPAERRWTGQTNGNAETGTLPTAEPLDDTAFLYFMRTLPLEVGREYTFDRYWNAAGNPVRVRVLRRETVTVPAGTFDTIVLQPIIRTSGMFAEGGQAEVYYAETGSRQLVMLRARVSFGTLQLQLEEFTPGRTARPS